MVVLTPHPSDFCAYGDKRALEFMKVEVIPRSVNLSEKPLEQWWKERD